MALKYFFISISLNAAEAYHIDEHALLETSARFVTLMFDFHFIKDKQLDQQ